VRRRLRGGAALLVVRMRADQALDTLCRQFPDGVLALAAEYASVVRAYAVLDKHGVAPGNALEDPDLLATQLAEGAADGEQVGNMGAGDATNARAAAVAALRMGMGAGAPGEHAIGAGVADGSQGGGRGVMVMRRLRAGSALEGADSGNHESSGAMAEEAALPGALEAAVASQLGLGGPGSGSGQGSLGDGLGGDDGGRSSSSSSRGRGRGLMAAASGTGVAKSSLAQLP